MTTPAAGDEFAGYRVVRAIDIGGVGDSFLVTHPRLARQELLTVLDVPDADMLRRAAALLHPHLVPILDTGEVSGRRWVSAAYPAGATDVGALLAGVAPMTSECARNILAAVADGLDEAHRAGLAHGHLDPRCILVVPGSTPRVFVAGVGLAHGDPADDQRRLAAIARSLFAGQTETGVQEVIARAADASVQYPSCAEFVAALGGAGSDADPLDADPLDADQIDADASGQAWTSVAPPAIVPSLPFSPLRWSGARLDREQLRGLACGAYFPVTSEDDVVDALVLGQSPRRLRGLLRRTWAISDADSALQTIDLLTQGLVTPDYDAILGYFGKIIQSRNEIRGDGATVAAIASQHRQIEEGRISSTLTAASRSRDLTALVPESTTAWELAQAVDLVRMSVTVGLITEYDAWSWVVAVGKLAAERYPDWTSFAVGFEWGRALASAESTKAPGAAADGSCAQTRAVITRLLGDPTSPWLRVALR